MATKGLYRDLRTKAKDDMAARLELAALHSTLDHFNVSENRDIFAEGILRFRELVDATPMTPADERTLKLMEMVEYFKKMLD